MKLDSDLQFLKDEHLEFAFKQQGIDREYAPELATWRESYIANCQKKSATLQPEGHAESILYITQEIELTQENWQRILLIAKGHDIEDSQIQQ
jgi:hypothetical protein